MLGNRHAGARNHKGYRGGNVQCVMTVTACAAEVDGTGRRFDGVHTGTHGLSSAGYFCNRWLAVCHGQKEIREIAFIYATGKNSRERIGRLSFAQGRTALNDFKRLKDVGTVHAGTRANSLAIVRKFCSSAWPFSDAMLSRMELDAVDGMRFVHHALDHHRRRSVAVTSRLASMVSGAIVSE